MSVGLKRLSRALTDHDLQYQRFQVYELNFSQHPSGSDSLIQMVARDKIKNFPIYLPLAYFPILKVDENRLVHKHAYCHVFAARLQPCISTSGPADQFSLTSVCA